MSDHPAEPLGNLPEYTVSELSQAVKQTVEGRFERVRVRGEITGFKRAASGHLYLRLKDESAVLDGVCWRGVAGRLAIRPEDGMEVIASGRLTTYPGRSSYQIVIDSLELAGEGALLKLLEERRRKLLAEGLFAEERKRPLPYLPEVIGVVTSPTGAVIRDILHRLSDRFPRRVLVWPVAVQGDSAAGQVAAAIAGFNALKPGGEPPRPDVLIVARGGGSLEDLWAFNEEVVVRAAAASEIPLISAVGHETDTTLIDFAADRRAPTPTAAAEIAVPVRGELLADLLDLERRLAAGASRFMEERRDRVEGLGRGLPDPLRLLAEKTQRLDDRAERLGIAAANLIERRRARVAELASRIPHPRRQITHLKQTLHERAGRLSALSPRLARGFRQQLDLVDAERRLPRAAGERLAAARQALETLDRLLESTSYHKVLARGFAVVRGPQGVITAAAEVSAAMALDIEFRDDQHVSAIAGGAGPQTRPQPRPKSARAGGRGDPQGRLL